MDFIINYWIECLFGLLISLITYFVKKLNDYKKILSSTTKGVEVLLKSKIIENYNLYKARGKISIYEKEIINELYHEYQNLGGNGVIDSLKKDLDKLPLFSKEE